MTALGRLEKADLHEAWAHEALDFTPWLAQPDNISLLAETLGYGPDGLEVEAVERRVGPFRADILARVSGGDEFVLIENQLERTDHGHLGQLITYAAGLHAATIIWIARAVTDEHRAALDWLNEITAAKFRFFAVEVELWRIGDSPLAPKFNLVSKPNDWSRSVAAAANDTSGERTEHQQRMFDFWTAFAASLPANGLLPRKAPTTSSWTEYPIGRTNFRLGAVVNARTGYIRAEFYIDHATPGVAKRWFAMLSEGREQAEASFGGPLDWQELPSSRACRVCCDKPIADFSDKSAWPAHHAWLADALRRLHATFSGPVRMLPASDLVEEELVQMSSEDS